MIDWCFSGGEAASLAAAEAEAAAAILAQAGPIVVRLDVLSG